jgi:hypothetical protein
MQRRLRATLPLRELHPQRNPLAKGFSSVATLYRIFNRRIGTGFLLTNAPGDAGRRMGGAQGSRTTKP